MNQYQMLNDEDQIKLDEMVEHQVEDSSTPRQARDKQGLGQVGSE